VLERLFFTLVFHQTLSNCAKGAGKLSPCLLSSFIPLINLARSTERQACPAARLHGYGPELLVQLLFGAAWLSGIGFTMSLFISNLALGEGSLLDMSKIGILAASLVSGACASLFLVRQAGSISSSRREAE